MKDWGIIFLFSAVLLYKFATLGMVPFLVDETLYGEMIAEEGDHITFLPKYLGYYAPWKPGLYFISYSFFTKITLEMFDSLEYVYRFPNLIFGLLNAFLIYLIAGRFENKATAIATAFFFYASFLSVFVEQRVMMESFMMFTMLLSLFFYTRKGGSRSVNFAMAGIVALASTLTKSVIALMIPVLAVAYMCQFERKELKNPVFLASLLAVPAGLAIFWIALEQVGMAGEIFFVDTGKMFLYDYVSRGAGSLLMGVYRGALLVLFLLVISIMGLARHWRENLFFSMWFLLFLVPMLSQFSMPWYFYYVLPPVCFFAAKMLEQKGRQLDRFAMLILVVYAAGYLAYSFYSSYDQVSDGSMLDAKTVGLMLSGKENVLFIGNYYPNTVSVSYKVLSERQEEGAYRDFGYVLYDYVTYNMTDESFREFVADYQNADYDTEEGFGRMFWARKIFVKGTNISKFDYVVFAPDVDWEKLGDYEPYYEGVDSAVIRRKA